MEDGSDPLLAYFSAVSAAELLIRPYRWGSTELTLMHAFLAGFPNLTALPVDLSVATQAAALRAATGIRLPDAPILASGTLAGCEAMISNDEQMEPLFRQLRWIYLADHL